MPYDQQVTSRIILQSLLELKRQGSTQALEHLEQVEPDLACYVMESLTDLHHILLAFGASAKRSKRLYRQVELLVLVCITALRKGHYELWRQTQAPPDDPDEPEMPSGPTTEPAS
jgi:hypothetical protein